MHAYKNATNLPDSNKLIYRGGKGSRTGSKALSLIVVTFIPTPGNSFLLTTAPFKFARLEGRNRVKRSSL